MKLVWASLSTLEIHHLKNLLQAEGIACRIRGESLSSAAGELPLNECAIRLEIEQDGDEMRALALIRDMHAPTKPAGPPWTCSGCGEALEAQFTACWRCGASRG